MEESASKSKNAIQCLSSLQIGIERFETHKKSSVYDSFRDSLIQRFKYSIDTFWKFLKLRLSQEIPTDPTLSPREIIREATRIGFIKDEEYEILNKAVADRNLTSHTYNEELASDIANHTPSYYKTMHAIMERLTVKRRSNSNTKAKGKKKSDL